VGIVGTFNTSQSCGALGFYAEKIATAGLVGVLMVTSPEFVAPHGAKQPLLGTNPITCAVPTDQGLFLMDQATAAFPWFGLLEAQTAGRDIPEGVAFDSEGQPTRDPNKALKGALRTFDRGYKSSNLALMVELLAGPLVGGAHLSKLTAKNWGNLVIAIDPILLGDPSTFYKSAGEVLERVRHADRLPGVTEMTIPGQREAKLAEARRSAGTVPIERNMLGQLREMAANWDAAANGVEAASATGVSSVSTASVEKLLQQLLNRFDALEAKMAMAEHLRHLQESKQQAQIKKLEEQMFPAVSQCDKAVGAAPTMSDWDKAKLRQSFPNGWWDTAGIKRH